MASNMGMLPANMNDPFWQQTIQLEMPLWLVGRLNDLAHGVPAEHLAFTQVHRVIETRAGGPVPDTSVLYALSEIARLCGIALADAIDAKVAETQKAQAKVLEGIKGGKLYGHEADAVIIDEHGYIEPDDKKTDPSVTEGKTTTKGDTDHDD